MGKTLLVTGGAGFIGSNFIRHILKADETAMVINLDAMTYAGVMATVDELAESPRHTFVHGDIRDRRLVDSLMPGVDVVVHFAAESHVDRSIDGPGPFLETNVLGTGTLLHSAMEAKVPTFVHVSTDEVYGSVLVGRPKEEAPLLPSSPYSASKAASELLVKSYATTFGYESIVTRCSNNFGPYQFPEKVIPRFVTTLIGGGSVPLYGDGLNERDWLHVDDHCKAIELLIGKGLPGETYNIGADTQLSNLELTHRILAIMGLDTSHIEFVPDRPGHDRRYALDSSKLRRLGWKPEHSLGERLEETVRWYQDRVDWWQPLVGASK